MLESINEEIEIIECCLEPFARLYSVVSMCLLRGVAYRPSNGSYLIALSSDPAYSCPSKNHREESSQAGILLFEKHVEIGPWGVAVIPANCFHEPSNSEECVRSSLHVCALKTCGGRSPFCATSAPKRRNGCTVLFNAKVGVDAIMLASSELLGESQQIWISLGNFLFLASVLDRLNLSSPLKPLAPVVARAKETSR